MPRVKVLLFGKAAELAESREITVEVPETILYGELFEKIFEVEPSLNPIKSTCVIAIDQKYGGKEEQITITNRTEIAVIPPLSGG
ncbi:unnamed protein product [Bursaphelenchus xylophilus]|uniref:(pine wood nematode) hypothetical protein n=1 Tax=Bursaphelenchus xylophilus TaxID=6326 RepID=A0A1I7SAB6_BURXY|nr:unnamed protein product [Bursaphelenchus xylophilus]CAG9084104.1 unnamed protein product [Bursaphelenchus xylophilus]